MADKNSVTVLVDEPTKRWLEAKAAERMARGVEHGKRSISAVVVDLIESAKTQDERKVA